MGLAPIRERIKSTVDIASILSKKFFGASILCLEPGELVGSMYRVDLGNIGLSLLRLNKKVAICADRKGNEHFFSVNLSENVSCSNNTIVAQGVHIEKPAILGFNSGLTDLDLQLHSESCFCSISIESHFLMQKLSQYNCLKVQYILENYNIFFSDPVRNVLILYLREFWLNINDISSSEQAIEEQILLMLIECFTSNVDRKVGIALKRCDRHEAALNVLSLQCSSPTKNFEVQILCSLLHQSRTSLFNGCREKFGMSPLQVVRSVRLHQVRHALMDLEFCTEHGISGVVDAASYFGFVGRSHFARLYKNEFNETPRHTLAKRRLADQAF
ncbi:MAG: AraC family transcriptional regulator [Synechococcus sp. NP17]|nr:AraC family transcriptional regulator [Synechococcus sp. NP17]